MKILKNKNNDLAGATLILGFFDGVHLGHRKVISSAIDFAKKNNSKTILLTFPKSPAEFFGKNPEYIYSRKYNYELISNFGVDYIVETDFSKLVDLSAEEYLKEITELYLPLGIFTGFNHTFGAKKQGNPDFLESMRAKYNYKYFCIEPVCIDNKIVSSTIIKELIKNGEIESANQLLGRNFSIESTVIKGRQVGRTLGFPTANMEYPKGLIKLPYGVYKSEVLGKLAVLNWGIKPTLGANKAVLEVHIPNFNQDLYGQNLRISVIQKLRSEKKFNNLEDLRLQIEKDIEECLK